MMREKMREYRLREGWSQKQMALRLGYHENQYRKVENGLVEPSPRFVVRLAVLTGKTQEEAKELLMQYDYEAYKKVYGEIEEA